MVIVRSIDRKELSGESVIILRRCLTLLQLRQNDMNKVERKQVSIRIPKDDYEFLGQYCPSVEGLERATWIAELVRREVRRLQKGQEP